MSKNKEEDQEFAPNFEKVAVSTNREDLMFGILKVRNIGVTKMNVLSMLFLQFSSTVALFWTLFYQIYTL
jgi:hypothetical protein